MIIDSLKIILSRLQVVNSNFAESGQLVEETKGYYLGKRNAFCEVLELIEELEKAELGEPYWPSSDGEKEQ